MPRVCFFVYGFPPDFSGATLQTISLAEQLSARKIDVSFLTYTYRKENLHLGTGHYEVSRFLRQPTTKLLDYHIKLISRLFSLRKNFDILYVNGNDGQAWTIFWAWIFCKIFEKKLFVELNMHVAGKDPLSILGTSLESLKLSIAARVDCYISNSPAISNSFTESYADFENLETISYGVDTRRFVKPTDFESKQRLRKKLSLPENAKIAMTCGGVTKRKGVDFLLDCWEKILLEYSGNSLLVIVGPFEKVEWHDSEFVEDVLKRLEESPLKGKVLLTGGVDNTNEYMQASDLFLFASRQEGSPSVLREAMSTSLPIVTLNLPGITDELIQDGECGVNISVKDYDNLANFANEPIRDTEARKRFVYETLKLMHDSVSADKLGSIARKRIEEQFSIQTKADKYISLFKTTCG